MSSEPSAKLEDGLGQRIAAWRAQLSLPTPTGAPPTPCAIAIARRVGTWLDIPVYDRQILQQILDAAATTEQGRAELDDRSRALVGDHLQRLLEERNLSGDDYLRLLCQTVLGLWAHGPAVLVGHGAIHIVPDSCALKVRLTAAEPARIARVAESQGVPADEAGRTVRRTDAERDALHQRLGGGFTSDLVDCDVAINTTRISAHNCAAMVVDAFLRKFPRGCSAGQQPVRS
jgi:hypothetical protein